MFLLRITIFTGYNLYPIFWHMLEYVGLTSSPPGEAQGCLSAVGRHHPDLPDVHAQSHEPHDVSFHHVRLGTATTPTKLVSVNGCVLFSGHKVSHTSQISVFFPRCKWLDVYLCWKRAKERQTPFTALVSPVYHVEKTVAGTKTWRGKQWFFEKQLDQLLEMRIVARFKATSKSGRLHAIKGCTRILRRDFYQPKESPVIALQKVTVLDPLESTLPRIGCPSFHLGINTLQSL